MTLEVTDTEAQLIRKALKMLRETNIRMYGKRTMPMTDGLIKLIEDKLE